MGGPVGVGGPVGGHVGVAGGPVGGVGGQAGVSGDMYPSKHVIEHQIRPARLDPLDNAPRPNTGNSVPQILPVPQPYIINTDGSNSRPQGINSTKQGQCIEN